MYKGCHTPFWNHSVRKSSSIFKGRVTLHSEIIVRSKDSGSKKTNHATLWFQTEFWPPFVFESLKELITPHYQFNMKRDPPLSLVFLLQYPTAGHRKSLFVVQCWSLMNTGSAGTLPTPNALKKLKGTVSALKKVNQIFQVCSAHIWWHCFGFIRET